MSNATQLSLDFRHRLQTELSQRCARNPGYSLRAFSRQLGLTASFLSKLMAGKRAVTPNVVLKCAGTLGLSPREVKRYCSHSTATRRALAKGSAPSFAQVNLDRFEIISDWCHFAILELMLLRDFRPTPDYVATKLGLRLPVAAAAIERLVRVGMIEIQPDGGWLNPQGNHTTLGTKEQTAAAFRKLQRQILEMAIAALEEIPVEERDQTAVTLALDPALVPTLRKEIAQFRRRICKLQESSANRDEVYHVSFSLYPVTRKRPPSKTAKPYQE